MLDINEYINLIRPLMKKRSVINETADHYPFGQAIDEALDEILKIAAQLGFETYKDSSGYYGYAQIGQGELFGVLGHVDVVSEIAAGQWSHAPFDVSLQDGILYGRGIEDDKGPLVLTMLALHDLLKQGYCLRRRVRFIIGCDEETLWRCMDKYTAEQEAPSLGFTPDGRFPLVNIEKTLYQLRISANKDIDFTFSGGNAINQVAAQARTEFNPNLTAVMEQLGLPYEIVDNEIIFHGKAAHVANSQTGINAISYLATAMKHASYDSNLITFIANHTLSPFGEQLLKPNKDELSGPMNLNVGKSDFQNKLQTIEIDMRLPITLKREDIDNQLADYAYKYNLRIEEIDYVKGLNVPQDSELVVKLLQAYQHVMKDDKKPLVSGGATYARAFANMVAFGPNFKQTTAHEIDEHISVEDVNKAYAIYQEAFKLLVCAENETKQL